MEDASRHDDRSSSSSHAATPSDDHILESAENAAAPARRTGFLKSDAATRAAYLLVGALASGAVCAWLQFSTDAICCGDFDGYYHIGWSRQLWQGLRTGHLPQFKWLPLTTLNAHDYVDHHFLFHVLQIPFTFFSDVRTGAKISAWLFATLALCSCYWLVVRYRLRYPLLWLVALLGCSAPFLFRMSMTKAMSVSIVLLVCGIHLLFQRKYLWLLPLAFIFTLTYDMFVLLGVAAFIWTCVVGWSEERFEWRPLVWVGVGIALGLVINPYFPHNLRLLYQHAAMKVAVKAEGRPAVGQEWYPYDSWDFLGNCTVAFIAMVAGYIAFNWHDRKRAAQTLFFLVFSTLLLIVNAQWRRFSEYWPPFAVLFAAFALHTVFERRRGHSSVYSDLPDEMRDELEPFLDHAALVPAERLRAPGEWDETWKIAAAIAVALLLCYPVVRIVRHETDEIGNTAPHDEYTKGIEWMRTHVPAEEVVFNTDWDDFPKLFYYDPTHAYVSGLDPTYLFDRDKQLSRLYEEITLGKNKDPGPVIRERFGARYVFTDNEDVHMDFVEAALASGWFDEAYADDDCTILYIREQKGPPPSEEDAADDTGDNDTAAPADDDSEDNVEGNAP